MVLSRLFKRRKADPLWDHFVNAPPADPYNDLTSSLRGAPDGLVFPSKTNNADPAETASAVLALARWWGADMVSIVALEPGSDLARPVLPDTQEGAADGSPQEEATGRDAQPYLFGIVCALFSEYDPAVAPGLGGQQVVQKGAVVSHYLGAYIRELGFRATNSQADPLHLSEQAGLVRVDGNGKLTALGNAGAKAAHVHLSGLVVTDLPLEPNREPA